MLKLIDGKKSYITGGLMIAIGVAELIGIDVIGEIDQSAAVGYIMAGLALISAKSAIKKIP